MLKIIFQYFYICIIRTFVIICRVVFATKETWHLMQLLLVVVIPVRGEFLIRGAWSHSRGGWWWHPTGRLHSPTPKYSSHFDWVQMNSYSIWLFVNLFFPTPICVSKPHFLSFLFVYFLEVECEGGGNIRACEYNWNLIICWDKLLICWSLESLHRFD